MAPTQVRLLGNVALQERIARCTFPVRVAQVAHFRRLCSSARLKREARRRQTSVFIQLLARSTAANP